MATGKQAGARSLAAVIVGLVAGAVIAATSATRAEEAVAREITEGIRQQLYTPIARATEQAQLLASQAEVREGLTERNRIRLRGALRPALARMDVRYVGVLLPDGTPYYWLPDQERSAPIIARRVPIEHELRSVGTLEFGAMLTDDVVRGLAAALATEVRLSGGPGPERPGETTLPDAEVVVSTTRGLESGYAYLRSPDDLSGPPLALLEFRVPVSSPGAARVHRTRNLLWALTAAAVMLVAGYDVRQRRRRTAAQLQVAFAPIPNPYIVGNPIRTPDMFFGRESDFQFAQQKLESERAGLVLVFCGERRSGKTSMLFQILNGRLGAAFLPVLIDMQYFAAISRDQDFYESVVREFVRAVYPESEQSERRQRFDRPSDGPAQSFELVLDDALAAYPDKTILFLFDEYEILESKIDRGELSRMVIPFLAGLLERKRRISFIFTGSRNLEERSTFHWRLMMGKSLYRKISYLTPHDTERLIRHPVQGLVDYDPAAVSSICRLTSGQPFYTQVICQNLIDYLNEVRRRTVGPKDVLAIVDGIVDNPLPQMIYFWDSLPAEEKVALSLLADTLGDETSWETAERLLADAREKGVSITTDVADLQSALERLFEKELLAKSADRTFQYRIDLLRHWIRRTHSIWQVVKEAGSVPHAGA
jgi:AAA+ ATPase superfamily predicted ATPase